MEDEERQHLLGEIARRDAEIAVLKKTIDALCRRVFGKSSEQHDSSQLELCEPPNKRPPPIPQTTDRRLRTAKPVVAPLPPSLLDRCIAAPGLVAEILDNRFACHLPYYRQAEIFSRQGVSFHARPCATGPRSELIGCHRSTARSSTSTGEVATGSVTKRRSTT